MPTISIAAKHATGIRNHPVGIDGKQGHMARLLSATAFFGYRD